ncbi:MAG: adenylosuccinate lyase [Crocinitomicaceae bacterium]|nr:adenylosuccinate lyase [Crocinitomicaceae bacterium]
MSDNSLNAISPIDGRYYLKTKKLEKYFSESALIRYRVKVEIEYFIALCKLPIQDLKGFNANDFEKLRCYYKDFTHDDATKVKQIEATTNHDVKAVEYFIKDKMTSDGFGSEKEFIHFGLTSQDINNTAVPMSILDALKEVYIPLFLSFKEDLNKLAFSWKDIPMLAKTHGQPASPTRLGKEIKVFVERLNQQEEILLSTTHAGKFGGATGNFNAHYVAYPNIDWINFANNFLSDNLKLKRSHPTTQIEHYDHLAALFDVLKRINTIIIDLNRDFWTYISMDYFKQKIKKGEIGSSAMPHKVNPIDFENSEGNLGIANAIFEHLSGKLPISRLQRDLSDSTVLRNVGVPFAHVIIAITSTQKGLSKLLINQQAIDKDLNNNWAVVSEAIQTILRREGVESPYEMLKDLTRKNEKITQKLISEFINNLNISKELKVELSKISPFNYTGI